MMRPKSPKYRINQRKNEIRASVGLLLSRQGVPCHAHTDSQRGHLFFLFKLVEAFGDAWSIMKGKRSPLFSCIIMYSDRCT